MFNLVTLPRLPPLQDEDNNSLYFTGKSIQVNGLEQCLGVLNA